MDRLRELRDAGKVEWIEEMARGLGNSTTSCARWRMRASRSVGRR